MVQKGCHPSIPPSLHVPEGGIPGLSLKVDSPAVPPSQPGASPPKPESSICLAKTHRVSLRKSHGRVSASPWVRGLARQDG
jgi:hypothetical protein